MFSRAVPTGTARFAQDSAFGVVRKNDYKKIKKGLILVDNYAIMCTCMKLRERSATNAQH